MKKRDTNPSVIKSIFITVASYMIIVVAATVMFLVSVNYQNIYDTPKNKGGVLDMAGYNSATSLISATLSGEWEFFYNRWIVTDNDEGNADALIKVPDRWTGTKINGKTLGRKGYASYRMILKNPTGGSRLLLRLSNFPVGSRAFINGELNMQSGNLSKDSKSLSSGKTDIKLPYLVTDETELEVVIEIGYSGYGGLFFPPWLEDDLRTDKPVLNFIIILIFIMVGAMFACVLFNFVIYAATGGNKGKWFSILFILLLFLHVLTTNEFNMVFGRYLNFHTFSVMYELCFISAFVTVAVFFISLCANGRLILNRTEKIVYAVIFALSFMFYYLLFGTSYQIVPIALGLTSLWYAYYKIVKGRKSNPNFEIGDLLNFIILSAMFGGEAFYNLGHLNYGLEALISVLLFAIMGISGISAFITLRKKSAQALIAVELEKENQIIKYNVYKNQVNPHFIFNALSSIQALYKTGNESGDKAIGRFSRHLRRIIDSSHIEMHSFNEELKIIMNYVELEKMRLKKDLQILFDIDFQDFSVPVLSLQPLIENAIRYSGVADLEGGFIRICSDLIEDKGEIVIIIEDNGKGFDTSTLTPKSTGLKNTAERYRHLLKAGMEINSTQGEGTLITITIPLKEAKKYD